MSDLVLKLVNMSISASFIVLGILLIKLVFRKMPKWVNMALWGLVALRLFLPFSLQSSASLIPSTSVVPKTVIENPAPEVQDTSIIITEEITDSATNEVISSSQSEVVSTPSNDAAEELQNEIVTTPSENTVNNPTEIVTDSSAETVIPEITTAEKENATKKTDSSVVVGTVVAVAWCVGVFAMLFHTGLSYFLIARKVKNGKKVSGNIIRSDKVDTPFIMGLIKPKIYIPDFMSEEDAQYVLAHENAHIKRRDYLWKPLGFAFLTVYWFNPLMWLAYILLCRDIEFACDEKVIKTYGEDYKVPYSKVLIECSIPRKAITACPVAFGEIGVKSRIKNILNYKKPSLWISVVALVLVFSLTACLMTDPVDKSNKKETKTETVVSEEEITDNTTSEPTVSEQSKPTESEPDKIKPETSKPTESKPTESKPTETLPGLITPLDRIDLKGEKIIFAAPWKHGPGESNSTANILRRQRVKYLEEKYNCKFEWIVDSDIERLKTSVAAHKPYVDFFTLYTSQLPSYISDGYLQDMDKIETVDLTEEKWIKGQVDSGVFNGGHYAFAPEQYAEPRFCIVFNKTMFEKNGWTLPYDLYKQDKWTWEECLKLAMQATDPDKERYGIGGMEIAGSSITASFGGEFVKFDKNGKPKFVGDSEECRLANEFNQNVIKKQYKDCIWSPESFCWGGPILGLRDGKIAMSVTRLYMIRENILNMVDDYGIVPMPKGSNKNGTYCSVLEDVPITVMLANNPLANEKCYVLNKFNEPYRGYDNVVARSEFEKICRDQESVECLIDMMNYGKFDRAIWFSAAGGEYSKAIGEVNSGKATFKNAMKEHKKAIESKLEDTYNSWYEKKE